jgi:3-oxoacyl-[acyl-carrier-protein] synthase-3
MSVFKVHNINIASIVSCVPSLRSDNLNDENVPETQGKKILESTGIRYRRIAVDETTADLCLEAAENIFQSTKLKKENVSILIFVSQTPDYILPATATILQSKLDLSANTIAFDISLGCSGYIYGLSVIASLLEKLPNSDATALLLVGDTISKLCNKKDLSTYPLFGDAGSATLLKKEDNTVITFDLHSDGKGAKAIIVEDGGFRNPYCMASEEEISDDNINFRRKKDLYLNGMDVFSFGITKVPKAIKSFYEESNLDESKVDYFIFHQANMFMNEKIRNKLKIPEEKVPYTLYDYANVSSATIPLTISSALKNNVSKSLNIIACGFGVGLSWGVANIILPKDIYLNTIEL